MKAVFYIVSVLCVYYGSCEDIDVDLSLYTPKNKLYIYRSIISLRDDKTEIKIRNINDDVGFFIIQVHSFLENVTLSYNSTVSLHGHVTGTNIGLIYGNGGSKANFYVFRDVQVEKDCKVQLVIMVYDEFDPVPGGCNLTFDNVIAPYQMVSYNDELITVLSQPPSGYGVTCEQNQIQVDMYHMFLPGYDNDIYTYFHGIEKMLTVTSIKYYGTKVPNTDSSFKYRRLYNSYRGSGEVFAVVATYMNRSSAYVPVVSYGCNITNWDESCLGPVTGHWKLICATLLFFGLFINFIGHRFFRTTLFISGFTFGVLVTYVTVSLDGEHFTGEEMVVTSLILGFFFGIIWVCLWWKFGVPLLSVNLATLLTGFLLASVIFYTGLADVYVYNSNINFWITFACIMVAILVIWTPILMYGHILSCVIMGSYAFIAASNYYFGGNLQYIIINTYRRMTVKNFNVAVIDPPYQVMDIVHTIFWIVLVIAGFYFQHRGQVGKPPFPPNRNGETSSLTTNVSERTPLLQGQNRPQQSVYVVKF